MKYVDYYATLAWPAMPTSGHHHQGVPRWPARPTQTRTRALDTEARFKAAAEAHATLKHPENAHGDELASPSLGRRFLPPPQWR